MCDPKLETEMSPLMKHADKELTLAGFKDEDSDYGGMLYDAVMELVHTFCKQGHSGGSAHVTLQLFNKVASYENIMPLSGNDDEWNECSDDFYQNNRMGSVFKERATGKAYYLDAIIWRDQNGHGFTGKTKDGIYSRQYIKSFPFTPKTFYIDVIDEEVAPDDWESTVKDREQLEEVWEYYDEFRNE